MFMKTNFFSALSTLALNGTLRINIQRQSTNSMIVSVLLVDDSVKDKALQIIPPLVLNGDEEKLDEGFFDAITSPLQQTSSLATNMSAYEAAQTKAQKESKQVKDKETFVKNDKNSKRKKFEEQMNKVNELEKQKKMGEAIGQLPNPKAYPEFTEEIRKKEQQLRSQHGSLSLFEEPENTEVQHNNNDLSEEEREENEDEQEESEDDFN
jgi:PRTRC genetic system protein E